MMESALFIAIRSAVKRVGEVVVRLVVAPVQPDRIA